MKRRMLASYEGLLHMAEENIICSTLQKLSKYLCGHLKLLQSVERKLPSSILRKYLSVEEALPGYLASSLGSYRRRTKTRILLTEKEKNRRQRNSYHERAVQRRPVEKLT